MGGRLFAEHRFGSGGVVGDIVGLEEGGDDDDAFCSGGNDLV